MKFRDEDEEDETLEIDQINKVIEKNLKLEIAINKNLEQAENFIKNNQWKILLDMVYEFEQDLERIWDIIKSLEPIYIINNAEHYPFIFKKGSDVWSLGNIFEGKILGKYEFNAKVIKQQVFSELKIIEWIFFLENGENLRLKYNIYKVTEDSSTVVHKRIKYVPINEGNIIFQIKEKLNQNDFKNTITTILKKEPVYLYQYESGVISSTMKEMWDILTDTSKIALIAPNNQCFLPMNINNYKPGDIFTVPINFRDKDGFLEIKIDLKEKKEGWNRWAFSYSILSSAPFKIPKQTLIVQLTKINTYETQLSLITKLYQSIPMEKFKCLSQQKKYVISSFKDYFENFSASQDDINN